MRGHDRHWFTKTLPMAAETALASQLW